MVRLHFWSEASLGEPSATSASAAGAILRFKEAPRYSQPQIVLALANLPRQSDTKPRDVLTLRGPHSRLLQGKVRLQDAGCFAVVLELVPEGLAAWPGLPVVPELAGCSGRGALQRVHACEQCHGTMGVR